MKYKCKLESHYNIPSPVLSILVGKLPKNKTTPPVTKESKTSLQQDSWDKEWSWGLEDEPKLAISSNSSTSTIQPTPPPPRIESPDTSRLSTTSSSSTASSTTTSIFENPSSPNIIIKESYLVSASAAGKYIVLAYQTKFVIVELFEEQEEYIAIGQGSGCQEENETITSILCLPLFVPSIRKNQIFVMIGYSTGWLRVFSNKGTLLTAQLLESSSLISIKLRTPPIIPPPIMQRSSSTSTTSSSTSYKSTTSTSSSSNIPLTSPNKKSKQVLQSTPVAPSTTMITKNNQDEEITLLFSNNKIISIDGQSLWMVLRVCDGQRESGIDPSKMQTAFTYKKWQLDQQDTIRDIISLGPSPLSLNPSKNQSTLINSNNNNNNTNQLHHKDSSLSTSNWSTPGSVLTRSPSDSLVTHLLHASSSTSSLSFSTTTWSTLYTSRFIAVGSSPMLSYYATHENSRPFMSAVSMASYVVSRVASPVFSFAKTWWSGSPSPSSTPPINNNNNNINNLGDTPYVPESSSFFAPPNQMIEPATSIPSILQLSDAGRTIQHISLAPPFPSNITNTSQYHSLAATSDSLGRVILWDIQHGDMIRIWKGVRDAHCGWIQYHHHSTKLVSLFLVIYSAKRGLLKIYHTRHGSTIGMFQIGQGYHLVPCGRDPLGSSMVSMDRRKSAMRQGEECGILSTCLLIGPNGDVKKITVYDEDEEDKEASIFNQI
ncbi:Rab3 GTPase-activating protein regulatory subunit N-terminus-domain-containing protein [Cunninghamella echinulata]|nr:Rab3 GTPase-activating protein regulatory subunit N-terminus-domain-containing protein [Cunninghamella echinulata]